MLQLAERLLLFLVTLKSPSTSRIEVPAEPGRIQKTYLRTCIVLDCSRNDSVDLWTSAEFSRSRSHS